MSTPTFSEFSDAFARWRQTRRTFVGALAIGAAGMACGDGNGRRRPRGQPGTCTPAGEIAPVDGVDGSGLPQPQLSATPFTLGVASGDPLDDRVVLWTRLTLDPLRDDTLPDAPIPVRWLIAADPELQSVLAEGTTVADPEFAHSVHLDLAGLDSDTEYWYRFTVGEFTSPVGRAKTLPCADAQPAEFRIAVASCQDFRDGFYTAYPHLVADRPDVVFFVGDYIYESGLQGRVRDHDRETLTTLTHYRGRYGLYRSDANLRAAHAAAPWIVTWDDHEVDNNHAGFYREDVESEAEFAADEEAFRRLRAAAYQAYYEHMPLRTTPPDGPFLDLFRQFRVGDLATFFVLDGRQFRTNQLCRDELGPPCEAARDPELRTSMLGDEQEAWLLDGLAGVRTIWTSLVQQVVFAPMHFGGGIVNWDQWDGYADARRRIHAGLREHGLNSNVTVLSGDIHVSMASRLTREAEQIDSGDIGAEFVSTSISSNGGDIDAGLGFWADEVLSKLPHVQYYNPYQRGYLRITITRDRWLAEHVLVATVDVPTSPVATIRAWELRAGDGRLRALPQTVLPPEGLPAGEAS